MTEEVTQAAPVETAVQADAPKWAPEVETLARDWGWKAPDEWKGDLPEGYIDNPERFVQRFEKLPPVQKLQKEVEDIKRASQESLRKIETVTAKTLERERAQFAAQLDQIKAQKVAAVEVGDVDAYKALERREEQVRQSMPEAPAKQDGPDFSNHFQAIEQWSVDRPWFKADRVKTAAATALYDQAQQNGLTDPKAILSYVDKEMSKQFADLAPKQPQATMVEGGLTFGGGSQASAFEKLPKDAKDAFRRFVDKGVFKDTKEDRQQYAEDYDAA